MLDIGVYSGEGGCRGGSGTLVAPDLVLTNFHVIDERDCPEPQILARATGELDQAPYDAFWLRPVVWDAALDVAVLQVDRRLDGADLATVATVGNSDALQVGDHLTLIGFPAIGGDTVTITSGTVAGMVAEGIEGGPWIKTDGSTNKGNSGGGAFDAAGRLVGIPSRGSIAPGSSINYVRPIATALPLIDDARAKIAARGTSTATTPLTAPVSTTRAPVSVWPPNPDPNEVAAYGTVMSLTKVKGEPGPETTVVPSGAAQACVFFKSVGVKVGDAIVVEFETNGVLTKSDQFPQSFAPGDDWLNICVPEPVDGVHELRWIVNGYLEWRGYVMVGGRHSDVTMTVQNGTSGDLCEVWVDPPGTPGDRFGQDRLYSKLVPGESRSFLVPSGSATMSARLCGAAAFAPLAVTIGGSFGVVVNDTGFVI